MIYHVTLHTVASGVTPGQSLTMAIEGKRNVNSILNWIERARRCRCTEPIIYWVTLDGRRWCLAPADLVDRIEVSAQPEPVDAGQGDVGSNVKLK